MVLQVRIMLLCCILQSAKTGGLDSGDFDVGDWMLYVVSIESLNPVRRFNTAFRLIVSPQGTGEP
jgi:hypothetical protein